MDLNRIIQIRPHVWCKVSGTVIRSLLVHPYYHHLLTELFCVQSFLGLSVSNRLTRVPAHINIDYWGRICLYNHRLSRLIVWWYFAQPAAQTLSRIPARSDKR